MTSVADSLWELAMSLTTEERRQPAYDLLETLEEKEPGYDEAWQEEIERRLADPAEAWIPAEEAFEQLFGKREL
jgi:Putative addiction module component